MNFKKYSLITGSAGLLGKYHAIGLLNLNKNLILTDLNVKKLHDLRKNLKKNYPKVEILCLKMNVTSEKSIKKVINFLKRKKIIVTILINNAALDPKISKKTKYASRLEKFSINKWNKEINVGLTGAMLCSKLFGNTMSLYSNEGVILNIASDLSIISPNQNIYRKQKSFRKKSNCKTSYLLSN